MQLDIESDTGQGGGLSPQLGVGEDSSPPPQLASDNDMPDDERRLSGGGLSPQAPPSGWRSPFQWGAVVASTIACLFSASDLKRSLLFSKTCTMSSHFSGVGSAEWAMLCLDSGFFQAIGERVNIRSASVCDSSRSCQQVLQGFLAGSSTCIFADITDLSDVGKRLYQEARKRGHLKNIHAAWKEINESHLNIGVGRACARHLSSACVGSRHLTFDVSGSPCQAWSRMGPRHGKHSPEMVVFLVWCKWARSVRPYVVVHENVPGFDGQLLETFLGDLFEIITVRTSPKQCGFAFLNRPRLYAMLLLRGETVKLRPLQETYNHITQAAKEHIERVSPSFCFVATTGALLAEENSRRRQTGCMPVLQPSRDWSYMLTPKQQGYVRNYLAARKCCGGLSPSEYAAVYMCNICQNPLHRRIQLCHDGMMPTFTRSTKLWVPFLRRWLLPCEMALAMGLPTTVEAAEHAKVDRDASQHSYALVGNMMHVACVGTVLAVALSCVAPRGV